MLTATPTINMTATGANIKALIRAKGLKVADVQDIFGFNKAQKREVRAGLSNTFGFGGHNACVVFRKYVG